MCGIAGIVGGASSRDQLARMSPLLRHRGPDGHDRAIRKDGTVGFDHHRLAVLDLSAGAAQPMESPAGSLITYNGEIYNYLELRRELEERGVIFRTESDTEVILAAYDRWGPDFLKRLNGMFAFAIYDSSRDVLVAARDRFGEKPFYYSETSDGGLAFASEMKALLALEQVDPQASYSAIYRFLALREVDRDPATFFVGIRSLPPASSLEFRPGGGLSIRRYWDLVPRRDIPTRKTEQVAEFRRLFLDSIKLRLRADVTVGSSLSGGLDSSAIVGAIAASGNRAGQHTFSARFPGTRFDEGRYIDAVVDYTGASPHAVVPDPSRIPDEWRSLSWHQETPFFSLSIYAQWCVMRLARDAGVTVLLDGQGADEVLGGYRFFLAPHLKDLFATGKLSDAVATAGQHVRSQGLRDLPVIGYNFLPRAMADAVKGRVRAIGLDREFAAVHSSDPMAPPQLAGTRLNQALYASLAQTMLPPLLRYGDRNSMAFGREVRLPFLDHRLVEYVFGLPNEMKMQGTRTKVVLRDAVADLMPPLVAQRHDKLGYAPPHSDWLRGPLRGWASDTFASNAFRSRPWIDAAVVDRAWKAYLHGADRYQSDVLRWLSLEGWADAYLDTRATFEQAHKRLCTCALPMRP